MPFNRPPRLQTPLPNDVVKIPAPPTLPSKPEKSNWLTVLLPLGAVLLSVILMVSFMNTSGSALSYLFFLPIMLVSYLAAILTTNSQKKNYEKKLVESRTKFRSDLRQVEEELAELNKTEKKMRLALDPDPGDCLLITQRADPRLGERRPDDTDFLHVRLGVGDAKANYSVEETPKDNIEEFQTEYEFIDQLTEKYTRLEEVPVRARLPIAGSIGMAGVRAEVLGVMRAFLTHLLVHHWHSEVNLAVCCSAGNQSDWQWLGQLPHLAPKLPVSYPDSNGSSKEPDKRFLSALEAEIQRREQVFETQKMMKREEGDQASTPLPRLVVVFDYLPESFHHPALNLLHKKGLDLGVHGIFLTEQSRQIPGDCGAVITVNKGRIHYCESGAEGYSRECVADFLGAPQGEMLANALTAIKFPQSADDSLPPETITFLQLFGVKSVEDLPLEKWWDGAPPYGFLRAPIGRISATSDLIFDLNDQDGSHGPHGLLGGMTGSGKSEVLKAIILALAVTHHPYDMNFALIDFKGGAAFNELARLPHTVGVVTDIESNATFAERVILALGGEIERRKRLLENARSAFGFGRSHIDEYRKQPVRRPLPRLVIVFDEFAEFKQRNPVESKKLISIARQGRSLGVHLILATQNIEAAVDPEILQNSSFRICLKVSEPQDSIQMVGIPDAVSLTRGRAYFSANTRILYQSAFSGARYTPPGNRNAANTYIRIWQDGKREVIDLPLRKRDTAQKQNPSTEAGAVVEYINQKAQSMHLKKPPAIWPEALSDRCFLPDLLSKNYSGGWDGHGWHPCQPWDESKLISQPVLPILGLGDLPGKQIQFPLQMSASQGGHLLVFGSAGSGKSTLLRTLVASLAFTQSPDDAHVYILDFGGQSALKLLESFPHVGAVVTRLESERAERLLQLVQNEVNRRNDLLREARVDSWLDFNATAPQDARLPALYLLVDGFRDFKQSFDNEFVDGVTALISGGQAAGLYLVIATSLQNDIPNDLFANINMRLTFNQADSTEYFRIVGSPSEAKLEEDAAKGVRPGRGLLRGTPPVEIQVALPTYGETDKEQASNLNMLAEKMNAAWNGKLPTPVLALPDLVTLPDVIIGDASLPYFSMLGLDFGTLAPTGFSLSEDGPAFMVGGVTGQCGKTTLLRSWLLGLTERYTPDQLQMLLVDFHTRTLAGFLDLPVVQSYVGTRTELDESLTWLTSEIERRQNIAEKVYEKNPSQFNLRAVKKDWSHLLVVIDDYDRLFQVLGSENPQLTECLRSGADLGVSFIISGNIRDFPASYTDHFIERFRKLGCGVLLGGIDGMDEYNNTRRPPGAGLAALPPGRGYMIKRGRAGLFQSVAYWQKDQVPEEALRKRLSALMEKTGKMR